MCVCNSVNSDDQKSADSALSGDKASRGRVVVVVVAVVGARVPTTVLWDKRRDRMSEWQRETEAEAEGRHTQWHSVTVTMFAEDRTHRESERERGTLAMAPCPVGSTFADPPAAAAARSLWQTATAAADSVRPSAADTCAGSGRRHTAKGITQDESGSLGNYWGKYTLEVFEVKGIH